VNPTVKVSTEPSTVHSTYLTTVASTSWSDTGLDPDTSYAYTVSAIDAAANESSQSTNASDTTDVDVVQTTFAYDAYGNMTTKAESAGDQTTFAYDSANRLRVAM